MKELIKKNIGLKISAILISVFLWFFVTSRGQSEMSIEVPIQFKNISSELGMVSSSDKAVIVTIKGQERLLKNLKPADIRIPLDMSRAKTGEATYYINKDDIKPPYAIKVINMTPSAVRVKIEEMVTKTVMVHPVLAGAAPKGIFLKVVSTEPRNVKIRGFKSEIRKVDILKTVPLDISEITESGIHELDIDTAGSNIRVEKPTVRVNINATGTKR